jgi:ribosomal protein L7/L12
MFWLVLLIGLVLGGILAYVWYRRRTRHALLPAPLIEIEQLLKAGKRAEALRLYREQTGASPTEARHALEALDMGLPGEALATSFTAPQAALEREIRSLLRAGRKISAIRLYQERTGVSLREARQAVDALGTSVAPPRAAPAPPPATSDSFDTTALEHQIRPLLRAGRKISAIRLYQERTGVSLREARQIVEHLERETGLTNR